VTALVPISLPDLVRRMRREVEVTQSIFDLPVRKWFVPDQALDFSALHFQRRAGTPVGPAAGPHTQLAQNIVLSWLAGSRIVELKTVQVNDRLEIPRPCIHVPNIGYNVEWSQELLVHESIMEYAKATYLIEILKHTRGFGIFQSDVGFDTVFDISVGYDLDGIRTEKVTGFIHALQQPGPTFEQLREQLTGDLAEFRDLDLPAAISDCVTLSTFHGCPADQIEAIARYLIGDLGLHTIIKLNPTLLGFEAVQELLVGRLGYDHLELRREAFAQDLQYDDGLEILRNLRPLAERRGSTIGAKFTNTLVVANNPEFFPTQSDPYMYVSGQPLHVISMNLMQRFRDDLGFECPVSFSGGVDAKNFPAAVACGMVPVTTCTDLLRQGGYGRLPAYLRGLGRQMEKVGVTSREAYVLAAYGHAAAAVRESLEQVPGGTALLEQEGERLAHIANQDPDTLPRVLRETASTLGLDAEQFLLTATRKAGRMNGGDIVPTLADDPRYHARSNGKAPRQIDSHLALYDCINCDLCIAACPNDAIFAYSVEPRAVATQRLFREPTGKVAGRDGAGFSVREAHQLALVSGACNECSNCEVYCPETGAPFRLKERVFLNRADYDASPGVDGFWREGHALHARLDGRELVLDVDDNRAVLEGDGLKIALDWDSLTIRDVQLATDGYPFDTAQLWRLKTVWDSIFASETPNVVNPVPNDA
jgi:putative selenate reductase